MLQLAAYAASLALVAAVNIVAGYWRAHAKARGNRVEWFLAVHAPVPLVALLRRALGIGFNTASLPYLAGMIIAYFGGQRMGAMIYSAAARAGLEPSRLLIRDLFRLLRVGQAAS